MDGPNTEKLLVALDDLKRAKEARKETRAILQEELARASMYEELQGRIKEARVEMKRIEEEALDRLGIREKIAENKVEIRTLQEYVNDLAALLLQDGAMKNGQGITTGSRTVLVPKVKVSFKLEQMAMPL